MELIELRSVTYGWFRLVPFIGSWLDFRRLQQLLRERPKDQVLDAWKRFGINFEEVQPICEAIASGGGWTSCFFVPDDSAGIVLFPDGDMGFESIAIIRELEKLLLNVDSERLTELFGESPHLSLGQFVIQLRKICQVDLIAKND